MLMLVVVVVVVLVVLVEAGTKFLARPLSSMYRCIRLKRAGGGIGGGTCDAMRSGFWGLSPDLIGKKIAWVFVLFLFFLRPARKLAGEFGNESCFLFLTLQYVMVIHCGLLIA